MAIVPCNVFPFPGINYAAIGSATATTYQVDASGERACATVVCSKAGDIRKVHFLTGTVVGNQTIEVSLQNVDTATGYPDGTKDQTVDIAVATGDDSVWKTTGNLSTDRTVAIGDFVSIVFEHNPFSTNDLLRLRTAELPIIGRDFGGLYTSSAWARVASPMIILLEMSDASFMYLPGSPLPVSNISVINHSSATNPVRYGNRINLPYKIQIDGVAIHQLINTNSAITPKAMLYGSDGTTLIATALPNPRPGLVIPGGGDNIMYHYLFSSVQTLNADTNYYIYTENTGGTNVSTYYSDFNTIGIKDSTPVKYFYYNTQHASSAPTETNTRMVHMNLLISGIDIPSGGGGLIVHPGMAGGMRG